MALLPIKPLNGHGGYLRWKESMLLRLHTLGVAGVLSDDLPAAAAGDDAAAAKTWAHDDAICRGHILHALSDRLLPDYARFATAADLWRALARTYDDRFDAFELDMGTGEVLLEQIAHAEALGVAAELPDDYVARKLRAKLPEAMGYAVVIRSGPDESGMSLVWDVARRGVASGAEPEWLWMTTAMVDDEDHQGGY
ncbi:hypothetical protein HU200_033403 [Digitaria exilis]|uniref:Uncharacterized protein n=1 Tax=Digitaria exilis TaxID=1010633 RepID=A0A835BIR9_9POAL|nr:hypothetical protein HU200_033403 [Digitaria exilis]